ncbi:MAG: exonuclease domain-containing protein [Bacillota bacterium]
MAELKQLIFFDFEMKCDNKGMAYETMEAIRIGAVKYNLETKKVTQFDQFIQPTTSEPLSLFCKNLTGIVDKNLETADSFPKVFRQFLLWIGGVKKSRFFSWSKSDMSRLKIDSQLHDLPTATIEKIESRYIDFQEVFSKRVSKKHLSVQNALALYGVDFKGAAHNPMYDAYNTLQIFLNYYRQPLTSDIEMVKAYILDGEEVEFSYINERIRKELIHDLMEIRENLQFALRLKDAGKLLKKVNKIVEKYKNILINRSGMFSEDVKHLVHQLHHFHEGLNDCYQEHIKWSTRVMILDDHSLDFINNLK